MKYIKKYEKWAGEDVYYILHIKKSFINFQIALDKLGCTEEFRDDWGVDDYNYDISEENMEYFKHNKISLTINRNTIGYYHFTIRTLDDPIWLKNDQFGGTIEITDNDIKEYEFKQDVNKYNL